MDDEQAPADGRPDSGPAASPPDDDLDGYLTPTRRFVRGALPVVGVLVALAMVLTLGRGLIDAWLFDRAGDEVEAELQDVLEDDTDRALARSVLLVRTVHCDGRRTSGTAFVAEVAGRQVLLTNRHVVEDAATVGLRSLTGDAVPLVSSWRVAEDADVATLEVDEPRRLPVSLRLAERAPEPGDRVRAVGFPGALPFTSAGTVTTVDDARVLTTVQTDPGASGSPLVSPATQVVVGQIYACTAEGIGVATSASAVRAALDALSEPVRSC